MLLFAIMLVTMEFNAFDWACKSAYINFLLPSYASLYSRDAWPLRNACFCNKFYACCAKLQQFSGMAS